MQVLEPRITYIGHVIDREGIFILLQRTLLHCKTCDNQERKALAIIFGVGSFNIFCWDDISF